MYAVSKDLRLVQDLLGHASPATTSIYVAASADAGRAAAEELARGLERRRRVGRPDNTGRAA